jgi:hypothetical protein
MGFAVDRVRSCAISTCEMTYALPLALNQVLLHLHKDQRDASCAVLGTLLGKEVSYGSGCYPSPSFHLLITVEEMRGIRLRAIS